MNQPKGTLLILNGSRLAWDRLNGRVDFSPVAFFTSASCGCF